MRLIAFILVLLAVNALTSFALAAAVRTRWLCTLASFIIIETLILLWGFLHVTDSSRYPDETFGVTIAVAVGIAPILAGTSIGFVVLASNLYRKPPRPFSNISSKS